jgi:hypothetical protein
VAKGLADFKPFTVQVSGNATVTLTALAPNSAATVVLEIGTLSTTTPQTCTALPNGSATATVGTSPLTGQLTQGPYCVQIRDTLGLGPLNYSLIVIHS